MIPIDLVTHRFGLSRDKFNFVNDTKTELNVKSGCHNVCIIISTERVVPFVIMIDEKSVVGSKRDIIGRFNILLYRKGHYPSRVQQLAAIQTHNNAYLADQSAG